LEGAGLLEDAVYVTVDGGPAPLVSGVEFRQLAREELRLPRLADVEKELPTAKEEFRLTYRIFRMEGER
jgi:hypothetical protein